MNNELKISPKLKKEHKAYLIRFAETRRTKQPTRIFNIKSDRIREEAKLLAKPEYFVGIKESRRGPVFGVSSVVNSTDYNTPAKGQPSLWCNWMPEGGGKFSWKGNKDSTHPVEWLKYTISHFLKPWGYSVNGDVEIGEIAISVKNNRIVSKCSTS